MARGPLRVPSVAAQAVSALLGSSSVSAGNVMEAAVVAATFATVQQKLSRTRFDDLSSTPRSSAGRGDVLRTASELRLQRCDLHQIEPERRPNWNGTPAQPPNFVEVAPVGVAGVVCFLRARASLADHAADFRALVSPGMSARCFLDCAERFALRS